MADALSAPIEVAAEPFEGLPRTPAGPPGPWLWRLQVGSGRQVAVLTTPMWVHFAAAGTFLAVVVFFLLLFGISHERASAPGYGQSGGGGSFQFTNPDTWRGHLFGSGGYGAYGREDGLQTFALRALVVALLGLATVVPITLGLSRRSGRIVFNRREGMIETRWRRTSRDVIADLPINNIAAVQLCSGLMRKPGEAGRYGDSRMVFEMNLVVPGLPRQRMHLLCNSRRSAIMTDAYRLAEFLGVPLLNHMSSEELLAGA